MKSRNFINMWLLLHTTLLSRLSRGFASSFELITRDDCVCPGSIIVYECNVTRGESIVYEGSAFNCPNLNNELLFLHNDHNSNQSSIKSCNNGAIVARTNSNTQNGPSFSSRLTVTINDNVMALEEINCSIDNGLTASVIGSYYIPRFNTEPPTPPTNITWEWTAGYDSITFTWSPVTSNCTNVRYNIRESGCGTCPNITTMASFTCNNTSNSTLNTCSISLQSVICGNATGRWSDTVYLTMITADSNTKWNYLTLAIVISSSSAFLLMGIGCTLFVILAIRKRVRSRSTVIAPRLQHTVNNGRPNSRSASQVSHKPKPNFHFAPSNNNNQMLGENYCLCQSDYDEITVSNDNYIYSDPDELEPGNPQRIASMFEMDRDEFSTRSMLSGCVRLEDESLTLDALLGKLRGKVDSKWQEFGLAIGHPKEMLAQLSDYSNEDCLIEILDYWLKHHPDQPTWKEVADALEEMQDYELAETILQIYNKRGGERYELAYPMERHSYGNV